jgi:glycosyltransferase involved in cell wall biosynthesis
MLSPLGTDVPSSWQGILAGRSGIGLIEHADLSAYSTRFGGSVKDFNVEEYLSVKEARKLGIPVVASPTGENAYIVRDGVSGWLPGSEDEWVERLCALIDSRSTRVRLGAAGREIVVERYSLASAAASLCSLLDRLTHRRGAGL